MTATRIERREGRLSDENDIIVVHDKLSSALRTDHHYVWRFVEANDGSVSFVEFETLNGDEDKHDGLEEWVVEELLREGWADRVYARTGELVGDLWVDVGEAE